ncbi:hypothetical protein [Roseibium sediminis]|nr:hypothetical protein [Roseibium sediminis]
MVHHDSNHDSLTASRPSPWPMVIGAMAVAGFLSMLVIAFTG